MSLCEVCLTNLTEKEPSHVLPCVSNHPFCDSCQLKMQSGFHAVICSGCRTHWELHKEGTFLVWVERKDLPENVKTTLDGHSTATGGDIIYVQAECELCTEETNGNT